jgi:hypothetical protein
VITLPILVSWGIWLARNAGLFENKPWPPFKIVQQSIALYNQYKLKPKVQKVRLLVPVSINKSKPWGYFDGACEGEHRICGLGFLLYFSESNYVTGSGHMGAGTNNRAELQVLLEFLRRAKNHNVGTLQVFEDSKLAIDWMNNVRILENLELQNLGMILKLCLLLQRKIHEMGKH